MPVAPTQTLVVQDGDETTPVVPIPVRLVTENGEPFQSDSGTVTVANVTDASELGKQLMKATDAENARTLIGAGTSDYVKPSSAEAITDLQPEAATTDIVTAFNKVLAALRSWDIIAS